MPQSLHYLKETPSQTAGPYVHIGLAPGRRDSTSTTMNWAGTSLGPTRTANVSASKAW
jgi:protocatechuate 3,4-dioxygenase beta subunit